MGNCYDRKSIDKNLLYNSTVELFNYQIKISNLSEILNLISNDKNKTYTKSSSFEKNKNSILIIVIKDNNSLDNISEYLSKHNNIIVIDCKEFLNLNNDDYKLFKVLFDFKDVIIINNNFKYLQILNNKELFELNNKEYYRLIEKFNQYNFKIIKIYILYDINNNLTNNSIKLYLDNNVDMNIIPLILFNNNDIENSNIDINLTFYIQSYSNFKTNYSNNTIDNIIKRLDINILIFNNITKIYSISNNKLIIKYINNLDYQKLTEIINESENKSINFIIIIKNYNLKDIYEAITEQISSLYEINIDIVKQHCKENLHISNFNDIIDLEFNMLINNLLLESQEKNLDYIRQLKIIRKIISNIINNPTEAKYKLLNKENQTLSVFIFQTTNGTLIIKKIGFIEKDLTFEFNDNKLKKLKFYEQIITHKLN
jgi:hypothetical protein